MGSVISIYVEYLRVAMFVCFHVFVRWVALHFFLRQSTKDQIQAHSTHLLTFLPTGSVAFYLHTTLYFCFYIFYFTLFFQSLYFHTYFTYLFVYLTLAHTRLLLQNIG